MKKIGEILREARVSKKYSFAKLEEKTKIRASFIKAIEKGEWEALPEYAVVQGFVKSISDSLGMDVAKTTAVLRRDYPPKMVSINPKPDVEKSFIWSPKATFLVAVSLVIIGIASYLGYQYYLFISPPKLEVVSPIEGKAVTSLNLEVSGETDSDATVEVNNQPVIVGDDGIFATELAVDENTKEVEIVSKSRSGKETKIVRKIEVTK